ncbi:sensor histidine kinase [Formosa haliotis]|uniref:sensor histidine kinase n=1 Tax=Formosa haliotis TaxID=1555194 RepID=UPI000825B990|nr:ATP-binding protein [Formosa haliotis]
MALLLSLQDDSRLVYYQKLKDSLEEAHQLRVNDFSAKKYNLDQEKERADSMQLLNEKKKRSILILQALGGILTICGVSVFIIFQLKHRKEKLEVVYNVETRISKQVHDEVANDVYQVMTKLQTSNINKYLLLDDLESIYNKTRDISRENNSIDLKSNFEEVLKGLLQSYSTSTVKVITKNMSEVNWDILGYIEKTTVYRVLQELLTNMKKHSNASVVVVGFKQNSKKINIDYSDNGVGSALHYKNGLQNTETRIKAIKGTIIFESEKNKGFKAHITI